MAILASVYNRPEHTLIYDHVDGAGKADMYNVASVWEQTNVQLRIEHVDLDEDCPITRSAERNKIMRDYIDRETLLFDSGDDNTTGNFSRLSKVWNVIKNPDGTINANYGLMVYHTRDAQQGTQSQWEWAKSRLLKNKDSRQAVMHFMRPSHQWDGNLDIPCTVFVQFLIRNDRLNFSSYMRANDLVYGKLTIQHFVLYQADAPHAW